MRAIGKIMLLSKRNLSIWSLALLVPGVFAVGAYSAFGSDWGADYYYQRGLPRPWTRVASWEDGGEFPALQAVVITRSSDTTALVRVLVETRPGTRIVLDEVEEPLDGRTTQHLIDERSGWWFEIVRQTNLKLESVSELGMPAVVAKRFMEEDRTVQTSVRAPGSISYEAPVEAWTVTAGRDLPPGLEAEGLGGRIVAGMSPQLIEAVRVLAALKRTESRDGSIEHFEGLLTLLDDLLDAHQTPEELRVARETAAKVAQWKMSFVANEAGTQLEEPQIRSFAKRFTSIELAHPLAPVDLGD